MTKKRILHFFVDEKVVNRAIYNFDSVFPGGCRYVVVTPSEDYTPKHVKAEHPDLTLAPYNSPRFIEAVGDVSQYQYILIHLLTWQMVDFVLNHPHSGYCWGVWGSDLYNEFVEYMGYNCYYDKEEALRFMGKMKLKHRLLLYPYLRFKHELMAKRKRKAIKRISFVSAIPGDRDLLIKYCPEVSCMGMKRGGYYPVDAIVDKKLLETPLGTNIVLGHSAYAAGNHVEIFRQLASIPLGDRKVIVPLSYGDVAPYILYQGKEIIGDHFCPLTEFIPLDDYNELMHSASTYIFNSYRQAAVGNIIPALYMGATVFMNERSPLVTYFRNDLGCVFFLTSELAERIDYRLTETEIKQNREAILKRYSEQAIFHAIRESYGQ